MMLELLFPPPHRIWHPCRLQSDSEGRLRTVQWCVSVCLFWQLRLEGISSGGSNSSGSTTCDKCDGKHPTDRRSARVKRRRNPRKTALCHRCRCPHFQKDREKHKDAWARPRGNEYDRQLARAVWSQVNYGCKNNPHQMGGNPGNFVLRRSGSGVAQSMILFKRILQLPAGMHASFANPETAVVCTTPSATARRSRVVLPVERALARTRGSSVTLQHGREPGLGSTDARSLRWEPSIVRQTRGGCSNMS